MHMLAIYNCNNLELTSTHIQSLLNVSQTYSLSNEINYNVDNKNDHCILCRQFVAWSLKDSSVALLLGYTNNEIYHF